MARSLNSDYLAQLFIRADTSKMDRALVEGLLDGADLPDEAKALLVFKRGCEVLIACPSACCFGVREQEVFAGTKGKHAHSKLRVRFQEF